MRLPPQIAPSVKPLVAAVLAVAVLGTSACGWFRKDAQVYRMSAESRPLEVPPDLDRPDTSAAMTPTQSAPQSVLRSQVGASAAAPAPAGSGFAVAGSRDEVYARVGAALEAIDGVTIASRAQLLGSYDVNYRGSDFLVRVTPAQDGSHVSAVDPRGVPAGGEAPVALMAQLRAALGL
jgi:uncharacterized lipoprotein